MLCRDGARGDPEGAPYDRIIATVGCPDLSWKWTEQRDSKGRMLIPLQQGAPTCDPLVKLHKIADDHLEGRVVGWSGFMIIQGKLSAPSRRDLSRIYEHWEKLGKPKLTDWEVEFFPKEKAPQAPKEDESWAIERAGSWQLVSL